MSNNFDMSSTGISIECNANYDTFLSRLYYDEEFNTVDTGSRSTRIAVAKTLGEPMVMGDVGKFAIKTKKCMHEVLSQYSDEYYMGEKYTREEMKELLNNIPIKYFRDIMHSGVFKLNKGYKWTISKGYCQGDYCIVIYHDWMTLKQIDNLLWDCPVSATVTINQVVYDYDEYTSDVYNWDKKIWIECIMADYLDHPKREYIKEQLDKMLKEELDYV